MQNQGERVNNEKGMHKQKTKKTATWRLTFEQKLTCCSLLVTVPF